MKKKIIVSVISDVVTDQRVQKECNTLQQMGYKIVVIGRKSSNNFLIKNLPYKVVRLRNFFKRGPLMYFVFNAQLFFYLLFSKANILWSNDLDTLLPNFIISKIKKCRLVYDSHEYFTQSVYKKTSRRIWEMLEQLIFPRLKNVITVSDSIKYVYEKKYHVPVTVIRNVPYIHKSENAGDKKFAGKKILIIQGRGINENRGAEEAVLMMKFLPEEFNLYFIGSGTVIKKLQQMVIDEQLSAKVFFINVLPYQQMMQYTQQSFLGLIFEKIEVTDHHRFALPNKFFDYIHAGIPVLSSKATEIQLLLEKYKTGDCINNFNPEDIAQKIVSILNDPEMYNQWKINTIKASKELNWENEEKILITFMSNLK